MTLMQPSKKIYNIRKYIIMSPMVVITVLDFLDLFVLNDRRINQRQPGKIEHFFFSF